MGLFGNIIRTTLTVVETPIAVTKDVFTAGGLLTDEDKTYTGKKLKELGKDYKKLKKDL